LIAFLLKPFSTLIIKPPLKVFDATQMPKVR